MATVIFAKLLGSRQLLTWTNPISWFSAYVWVVISIVLWLVWV